MVAIEGKSGSGKSTVVSLMTRLYDLDYNRDVGPDRGTIKLDGIPLHANQGLPGIDSKWLQERIGVVNQEPSLLSGTIEDNHIIFYF